MTMTHFQIAKNILSKTVDDEEVVVDLTSGTYFGLNSMGSQIWQALKDGESQEQIFAKVCETYEAESNEIREDLELFLKQLEEKKWITKVKPLGETL